MFGNVPASDQQINGILVRRASIVKGAIVDCLSGFQFVPLDGRGRGGCGLLGGLGSFHVVSSKVLSALYECQHVQQINCVSLVY